MPPCTTSSARSRATPSRWTSSRPRYADVWRTAALTGLDYEIVSSLVNPQAAQVRYRLNLHSAVFGDIVRETYMDLTRAEDNWRVAWSDSAILPELAGGNTLFADYTTPTRANIYDRNGLGLATETDAVALWIDTGILGDEEAQDTMLRVLGRLLNRRPENIQALYEDYPPGSYYIPLGEVSLDDFRSVEGTLAATGGVGWQPYSTRYYPSGGLAPQSVGYVSQIQLDELADYQAAGYRGDEMVGREGLEDVYEDELRGKPGGTLYVNGPEGQVVGSLVTVDPQLPQAVYTTIDRDLQRQAQDAIADFEGAIVVLERDTGRVLALVSSPGFDPNLFDTRNPNWQYGLSAIFEDPRSPTINRATDSSFPLGSVFKMITMSAGLETGLFQPDTVYNCTAEFTELPGQIFYDWTVEEELPPSGELTLLEGLMRSCNPYFWHIGLTVFDQGHPTAIPDMAKAFGLGALTGIEIDESAGLVPDPDWKQQSAGTDWAREELDAAGHRPIGAQCDCAAGGPFHRRAGQRRDALPAAAGRTDPNCRRRGLASVRADRPAGAAPVRGDAGGGAGGDGDGRQFAARHGLSALPQLPDHGLRQDRHGRERGGRPPCLVRRLHR